MNEARAEELGAAPVKPELQKIAAITTLDAVATEAGALSAINAGGPVNVGIDADAKDPGKTSPHSSRAARRCRIATTTCRTSRSTSRRGEGPKRS